MGLPAGPASVRKQEHIITAWDGCPGRIVAPRLSDEGSATARRVSVTAYRPSEGAGGCVAPSAGAASSPSCVR